MMPSTSIHSGGTISNEASPLTSLLPLPRTTSSPVGFPIFDSDAFALAWVEVGERLRKSLRNGGCSAADAQDIAQDTAEALLLHKIGFTNASDLYPYAVRTAWNAYRDEIRRRQPTADLSEAEDLLAPTDVPATVEAHMALDAIATACRALTVHQRDVLLGCTSGTKNRRNSVRDNVLRYRLRKKLLSLVAGLLTALGVLSTAAPLISFSVDTSQTASERPRIGREDTTKSLQPT
jgi:hypothetical protein